MWHATCRASVRACVRASLFLVVSFGHQSQVAVLDRPDGRDVPLLDRSSLDPQPNATPRRDDHLLVVAHPRVLVGVPPVKHVLRHGVLRDKDAEGSDVGEKAERGALADHRVQDLVDKGPQQQCRVLDVEDDVSRVVFDDPRFDLVFRDLDDVDDKAVLRQREALDFLLEEADDRGLEFGAEIRRLQHDLVFERLDVKHCSGAVLCCVVFGCIGLYWVVIGCVVFGCIVLGCVVLGCVVLGWVGLYLVVLYWVGLYWVVLYWVVLYWVGLYRVVLYWVVLYWVVLYWVGLGCIWLCCIGLGCIGLYCIGLYYIGLGCIGLYCIGLCCIGLCCIEFQCRRNYSVVSLLCPAQDKVMDWIDGRMDGWIDG